MHEKTLFDSEDSMTNKPAGPVTCLGMTFDNDDTRRAYFTEELRKKLQDPEFRKIEGFPIGSDEDILNLSDPPYYTACPNPWVMDYVSYYGHEYDSNEKYSRGPLAIDVSVGKSDPVYKAHSYHTKVPHLAIVPSILHYTDPGDVILDGFCGTGMTGVAAQWCGFAPDTYWKNYNNENVFSDEKKPKKGLRRVILNDLSPAATFIAANYNLPVDVGTFCSIAERLLDELEKELGWMYSTFPQGKCGVVSYTVWSEVFTCPECAGELVFYEYALDDETSRVKEEIECPHCAATLNKKNLELVLSTSYDGVSGKTKESPKRVPVLISYKSGRKKYEKTIDGHDLEILSKIAELPYPSNAPKNEFPDMQMMRVGRMKTTKVSHIHDMFLPRSIQVLAEFFRKVSHINDEELKRALKIIAQHQFVNASIMNRYRPASSFGNSPLTGVFYVSSLVAEANVIDLLRGSINRIKRMGKSEWGKDYGWGSEVMISTSSAAELQLPENCIDYIFTDPPFGENIYYSDLNYLVESWYGVITDSNPEAIIDRVKHKGVLEYQHLMQKCFDEYYRVLKPGRWMTVVFSNSRASVWNAIQIALQQSGFVVAEVNTLDKKHRSFQQILSPNAVKQDLVISAYKPNGGLEERFISTGGTAESAWDFVRTHLRQLPVTKFKSENHLDFVLEREPRRIFDRLVAWFVRHDVALPLSLNEFLSELRQRYPERDGMVFLPEQTAEYDKKRIMLEDGPQIELFVTDEASAIAWLRQLLRGKPQLSSDINPQFMQQLGGWSKNEAQLDLRELLNQNFLCYDGKGPVPEQIHSYLSSNWKELRNLPKDDPTLVTKARDRWYVPDPNKAGDLEKLREKALLKEFEEYKEVKKKIKVFRLEAVRAGFKKAWQDRDYETIISVAGKIPNKVLEEDPKLLMWYDQAVTRLGNE